MSRQGWIWASLIALGVLLGAFLPNLDGAGDELTGFFARNGDIAYESGGVIRVIPADANGQFEIGDPNDGLMRRCPSYSTDGTRLGYLEGGSEVTFNVLQLGDRTRPPAEPTVIPLDDGRGLAAWSDCGTWSPHGHRVAFVTISERCVNRCQALEQVRQVAVVDLRDQTVSTIPVPWLDTHNWGQVSWLPNGELAVVSTQGIDVFSLADGSQRHIPTTAQPRQISWAPDGTRFAIMGRLDGQDDIYLTDHDGSNELALTQDGAMESDPAWSPDGRYLAFAQRRCDPFRCTVQLVVMDDDRLRHLPPARIEEDLAESVHGPLVWAPDSQFLLQATTFSRGQPTLSLVVFEIQTQRTEVVAETFAGTSYSWQRR